jgi:hypothetical protein
MNIKWTNMVYKKKKRLPKWFKILKGNLKFSWWNWSFHNIDPTVGTSNSLFGILGFLKKKTLMHILHAKYNKINFDQILHGCLDCKHWCNGTITLSHIYFWQKVSLVFWTNNVLSTTSFDNLIQFQLGFWWVRFHGKWQFIDFEP